MVDMGYSILKCKIIKLKKRVARRTGSELSLEEVFMAQLSLSEAVKTHRNQ
jgi:hypothetical protein